MPPTSVRQPRAPATLALTLKTIDSPRKTCAVRAAGWLRADGRALGALPARRAVATLDANKPVINALLGLVLILVLAAGLYRASVVNPTGAIAGFDESGAPMMRKQAPR